MQFGHDQHCLCTIFLRHEVARVDNSSACTAYRNAVTRMGACFNKLFEITSLKLAQIVQTVFSTCV